MQRTAESLIDISALRATDRIAVESDKKAQEYLFITRAINQLKKPNVDTVQKADTSVDTRMQRYIDQIRVEMDEYKIKYAGNIVVSLE